MPLPLVPNTTYVPGTTPAIKSADLNDLQKYLAGIYSDLYSTKGLSIDGTGGAAVTPANRISISKAITDDTPMVALFDAAGNARGIVDHNGFLGTISTGQYRQQWLGTFLASPSNAPSSPDIPDWHLIKSGAGATGGLSGIAPGAAVTAARPWAVMRLGPGAVSTDFALALKGIDSGVGSPSYRVSPDWFPSPNIVISLEFIFTLLTSAANITWDLGFTSSVTEQWADTNESLRFRCVNGGQWTAVTSTSGSGHISSVFTGLVPIIGAAQRLRIEWHGANTPLGVAAVEGGSANTSKVRFFINGDRTNTLATAANLPALSFGLAFSGYCTGAVTGVGDVGPVVVNWTNFLTPDLI